VVRQMQLTAGKGGRCLITMWSGTHFATGVHGFYKLHPELCGEFDVEKDVDFERRRIVTPIGYESEWYVALHPPHPPSTMYACIKDCVARY
jgi:hypothetical protein